MIFHFISLCLQSGIWVTCSPPLAISVGIQSGPQQQVLFILFALYTIEYRGCYKRGAWHGNRVSLSSPTVGGSESPTLLVSEFVKKNTFNCRVEIFFNWWLTFDLRSEGWAHSKYILARVFRYYSIRFSLWNMSIIMSNVHLRRLSVCLKPRQSRGQKNKIHLKQCEI